MWLGNRVGHLEVSLVNCVCGTVVAAVVGCFDVPVTPREGTVVTVCQCFVKTDVTHHHAARSVG